MRLPWDNQTELGLKTRRHLELLHQKAPTPQTPEASAIAMSYDLSPIIAHTGSSPGSSKTPVIMLALGFHRSS